jgi:hypothetical protein
MAKPTHILLTRTIDDDEGVLLDIAPTMKRIICGGKTFTRWRNVIATLPDGTVCQRYGNANTLEFMTRTK